MKKILTTLCVAFSFILFSPMANANPALDEIISDPSTYQFSALLQLLAPDKNQEPNELLTKLPTMPTRITWMTLKEDISKYHNHPAHYGNFKLSPVSPKSKSNIYINDFDPVITTYPQKDNRPPQIRLGIDYFYRYFTTPSNPFEDSEETTSQLLISYFKQQNITFEVLETPTEKPSRFSEGPTLLKISLPNKKDIWLSIKAQLTNRAHITDILILYANPQNDKN